MKGLQIERIGQAGDFHFSLRGVLDPEGARKLDRVLLKCQSKSAGRVRLDFDGVESISCLGLSVLTRWGKVYQGTERRIEVNGASAEVRASLQGSRAILFFGNAPLASEPAKPSEPSKPADDAKAADVTPPVHTQPPVEASVPEEKPAVPVKSTEEKPVVVTAAPPKASSDAPVGPEMASLQTKLKRKIVEFRNLFEITQALNLAQDLDEVMNLFGLSVMGQFGLERLALFLTDPDKDGHLVPRHVRGFPQHHFQDFVIPWTAFRRFGPDKAFMTLQDLETKNTGSDELEALRETGFEWAVLLWVRRDLEGVLFVSGRGGGRKFTEDDRDLLTILAHQVAVAISNARVQRAQEERNLGLVRGMMALIESRDGYAKGST